MQRIVHTKVTDDSAVFRVRGDKQTTCYPHCNPQKADHFSTTQYVFMLIIQKTVVASQRQEKDQDDF